MPEEDQISSFDNVQDAISGEPRRLKMNTEAASLRNVKFKTSILRR